MKRYKEYVPFVLLFLLLVLSFFIVRPLLTAIFIGALLAYIFYPVYKKIKRKNKTIPALVVCLGVLILLLVPGIFFVKTLIHESYALFVLAKQKLAVGLFKNCTNMFCETVKELGQEPEIQYQVQQIFKTATNWIIQKGSDLLFSVPKMLLNLFVMFFTMFYFLKDGKLFVRKLGLFLSMKKHKYAFILKRLDEITQGVVYGYLVVAFIQGAVGALGFFLFGLSSPLFWGLVMALLALIPYLGTGFVWIPASVILFLDGAFQDSNWLLFKGIALFFYGLIIISGLDNILKPKLVSARARIHPAIVLLGILGGIFVFGPVGVIVGPLILSLTIVFSEAYVINK